MDESIVKFKFEPKNEFFVSKKLYFFESKTRRNDCVGIDLGDLKGS